MSYGDGGRGGNASKVRLRLGAISYLAELVGFRLGGGCETFNWSGFCMCADVRQATSVTRLGSDNNVPSSESSVGRLVLTSLVT
jgi:hypothetical protein